MYCLRFEENGLYGYRSLTYGDNSIVIPAIYEDGEYGFDYQDDIVCVKRGGQYGCIDSKNSIVIPFIYEKRFSFNEEQLAAVQKNRKYGFIDRYNNIIIPFIYDYAGSFKDGRAIVKQHGKSGVIDLSGNIILDFTYDDMDDVLGDDYTIGNSPKYYYRVERYRKAGVIDKYGNIVVPIKYDDMGLGFSEGMIIVYSEGKRGFDGENVIPCIYDEVEGFSEGLALVKSENYYGFIDKIGSYKIIFQKHQYYSISSFHGGVAVVEDFNSKFGCIDKYGDLVIPFIFDRINDFNYSIAKAEINNKEVVLNKSGRIINNIDYDKVIATSNDYALIGKGKEPRRGLINIRNNVFIPCEFDNIIFPFNGEQQECFIAKKNNRFGIVDKLGNHIVPFNFNSEEEVIKYYNN